VDPLAASCRRAYDDRLAAREDGGSLTLRWLLRTVFRHGDGLAPCRRGPALARKVALVIANHSITA
jgi:hypothetical protein